MKRFYFQQIQRSGDFVTLDSDESRHVSVVLRQVAGDEVELFDGSGCYYRARIESVGKTVQTRILEKRTEKQDTSPQLWLALADLKGKKLDLVIQKSTELGVHTLLPFFSCRSQGRKTSERKQTLRARRRKIVESACKQCGRLTLMDIIDDLSFEQMIERTSNMDDCLKFMLWEKEHQHSFEQLRSQLVKKRVLLMVGPEGGFSEAEVNVARGSGWQTIGMGKRILRAETAAISAVTIAQFQLGGL